MFSRDAGAIEAMAKLNSLYEAAKGLAQVGNAKDRDLCHYIPTLARRSRRFPREAEKLQADLAVFVPAYNRFGLHKD